MNLPVTTAPPKRPPYPHLAQFLGAWLNQDFDLTAPTWQGVVDAYRAETAPADRAALRDDIEAFVSAQGRDAAIVHTRFHELFTPEIVTTCFASTTLAFLESLHARLAD